MDPKEWLEWAFRRHVPSADLLLERARGGDVPKGVVGETLNVLIFGRQVGWEEADDLMTRLHREGGEGIASMSARVHANQTGRKGGSRNRKRSAVWKDKVDAFIAHLRKSEPSLFEAKKYVVERVLNWVRKNDITNRSDKTVRDYVYEVLK